MSAFVLSEKAYSSICSAILTYKDELPKGEFKFGLDLHPHWESDIHDVLFWLKRMLLLMNVESVNYRYDEFDGIPDYTVDLEEFPEDVEGQKNAVTKALRHAHSWHYQSCEIPNCEQWWQFRLMECLMAFLSRKLLKLCGKPVPEDEETCINAAECLPIYRDSNAWH